MKNRASHDNRAPNPIELSIGCVSSDGTIELRRATENDFDWMIALRNQPSVRQWFFDPRIIDPATGRTWLTARANSNDDTVLVIWHKATACRVGTLGWICANPDEGIYETGRLALDSAAIRTLRKAGVPREVLDRMAINACFTLRDYLFGSMKASVIRTEYKAGNVLAAKINVEVGMLQVDVGNDGRIACRITRSRWQELLKPANTQ
jgi:hypothetical protein